MSGIFFGIIATIFLMTANAAEERQVNTGVLKHLKSVDGTKIAIGYTVNEYLIPGDSIYHIAKHLEVRARFSQEILNQIHWNRPPILKLINKCRNRDGDSYFEVYHCTMGQGTGGAPYGKVVSTRNCKIETYNRRLSQFHPDIVLEWIHRGGHHDVCVQEIAINYSNNNWLVNPVGSGPLFKNHNFQFRLPY